MSEFIRLSIVIPVGPDDSVWRHLLNDLAIFGTVPEIILSACQPRPDEIDFPDNARWLQGPQGRARQLNAGARQAMGDMIWFVHADTRLTKGIDHAVQSFIDRDECGLAYFRLKFADDGPVLTHLNAWAANIRSRLFALPFGDQGYIIDKSVFVQLNGFDEAVTLGEDLDFAVRAKANGFALRELPAALITSARRYRQQGWLVTTLRHVCLTWQLTRQAKRRLSAA